MAYAEARVVQIRGVFDVNFGVLAVATHEAFLLVVHVTILGPTAATEFFPTMCRTARRHGG